MPIPFNLDLVLPRVTKPARYTGNEYNSITKDHAAVDVTFALAFPDVYEVGMSHLGTRILYHELNRRPDTAAERVFAPWVDMEAELRRHGWRLFALESRLPVREFDILGFTLQYEMSYTNILNMLDLAGIPLRSAERGADDPLVIAGGPCAFNPEPLADFFDLFVLGEGEEVVHEIIDAYRRRNGGAMRRELLADLAKIDGVYVPAFYRPEYLPDGRLAAVNRTVPGVPERVRKRVVTDLDRVDYPTAPVVPYLDIVHDRAMVEVFRGCTRGCRFCQAGTIYRPVRERSGAEVRRLARELVRRTGHDEISLVSLSSADYTCIEDVLGALVDELGPEGVGVSLPSLRVDTFSLDLAEQVQRVRKTGLTFAPEAGTERLRRVVNKGVTEEDLLRTAAAAFQAGWRSLKLYFMIGLPTEEYGDLDGIAALTDKLIKVYRDVAGKGSPRLTVSASTFVPKPHTPFQWEPFLPLDEVKNRQAYLRARLKDRRVEFNWHEAELSYLEAVFARGDRRLAPLLEAAWHRGCRFDGWTDQFRFDLWREAFAETGIDPHFYATRPRDCDEVLPWDHLDAGVSKRFLIREHEAALRGETTADCRWGPCAACGACPTLGADVLLKGERA